MSYWNYEIMNTYVAFPGHHIQLHAWGEIPLHCAKSLFYFLKKNRSMHAGKQTPH